MRLSKLFKKFLFTIVVLFGVSATATALLSAFIVHRNLTLEYISKGRAIADSIASSSVENIFGRDSSTVQSMIDEFLRIDGVAYVYVTLKDGSIIAHTFVPQVPSQIASLEGQVKEVTVRELSLPKGGNFIQVSAPVSAGVAGTVHVGMDKGLIEQRMLHTILEHELLMFVLFLFCLAIFYPIVRGVSRPLLELSDYAQKLAAHDFSAVAPKIRSKDEIGVLASSMSQMAGELSTLFSGLEKEVDKATTEYHGALAYMQAIIDNLADGLLVTDIQGSITHVNPALGAMYDLPEQEVVGLNSSVCFPEAMASLAREAKKVSGEVLTREVGLARGRVGKAVATAVNLKDPDSGEPTRCMGAVILVRDITAEKEIDLMKTEFISTVSHELRTPLTSILGFAKMIKKKFTGGIVPRLSGLDSKSSKIVRQVEDNLGIIVSEGQRLTDLVNDVLDIAKMESGKVEWRFKPVAMDEVINWSLSSVGALAETKGLYLRTRLEPDLPLVTGDRDRLVQVVVNLVSNAIKFTQQGGVTVWARQRGDALEVCVSDTGLGVSQAEQGKIFEKFKQGGDTLTDKPKGTGLGLPICKNIVERHGGEIWMTSRSGQGSDFYFTLPLEGSEAGQNLAQGVQPGGAPRDTSHQPLILVVDDEPPVRSFLEQLLSEEGYEVLTAPDGLRAMELARTKRPELITMDLMMPGLDGASTIRLLRNNAVTRDIPILAISALPSGERDKALADAQLSKPIDEDNLLETIEGLLRGPGRSKRPCLVLGSGQDLRNRLLFLCPGDVTYCALNEIWKELDKGFSGTVFIPTAMCHDTDIGRICSMPGVRVVILPD